MAPQSPVADRWKTRFYYSQGSEAFKGDLYFYSVDHDLRDKLGAIDDERCPAVMFTGRVRLPRHPGGRAVHRSSDQERLVHRDERDRALPMSENYGVFRGYLEQALEQLRSKPPA
jgi:hypothetical protein